MNSIVELFTITFTDGTKIWANMQNNKILIHTFGKGMNSTLNYYLHTLEDSKICYSAYCISTYDTNIVEFIDHANEASEKLERKLLGKSKQ